MSTLHELIKYGSFFGGSGGSSRVAKSIEFTAIAEGTIPAGSDNTSVIDTGVTWADVKDYDWFEIAIETNVSTSGQAYYFFKQSTIPAAWNRFMLTNGYIGKSRFKKLAPGIYEWFSGSGTVAASLVTTETFKSQSQFIALNGPSTHLVEFDWADDDKFYIYMSKTVPSDQKFRFAGINFK